MVGRPVAPLVIACLVVADLASCFPQFEFDGQGGDPTTTSVSRTTVGPGPEGGASNVGAGPGSGGFGTGPGGGGGVTSAGGGGSPPMDPTVACGPKPSGDPPNAPLPQCAAHQLCCFHQSSPSQDHCQTDDMNPSTDDCGGAFYNLFCDGPEDCPGATCCARYSDFFGIVGFDGLIECAPGCGPDDRIVCSSNADCPSGTCQPVEGIAELGASEYQYDYRECR